MLCDYVSKPFGYVANPQLLKYLTIYIFDILVPSCQGPGGSSELGEWKVEAHGNVVHPTSRNTCCVPFRSLNQVSPRVLKARSGFEVNLTETELHFFHEVSMAFAWNQRAPKQICTYLHMCDKLQEFCWSAGARSSERPRRGAVPHRHRPRRAERRERSGRSRRRPRQRQLRQSRGQRARSSATVREVH